MGLKTGDKSRYHRNRRKKLARREQMRALRKEGSPQTPAAQRESAHEETQ
jgi:hypothetical protein